MWEAVQGCRCCGSEWDRGGPGEAERGHGGEEEAGKAGQGEGCKLYSMIPRPELVIVQGQLKLDCTSPFLCVYCMPLSIVCVQSCKCIEK